MIKVGQLSNSGSGKYLSYTNMIRFDGALEAAFAAFDTPEGEDIEPLSYAYPSTQN